MIIILKQVICKSATLIHLMEWLAGHDQQGTTSAAATQYRHGAKALITSDAAVLLTKEYHADGTPFWTLPGGGVHPSESLAEGLRRELREELGCTDVVVGDRTDRIWYVHQSRSEVISLYTVFECYTLCQPTPDSTEGVAALQWARADALPPATLPQVKSVCQAASLR